MNRFIPAIAVVAALGAIGYQSINTQEAYAQKPMMTKGEVQAIVKEYLVENPQVVVDALEAYRAKQEKEAEEKAKKAIEDNKTELFEMPTVPSVGPVDADIVIAEFFDYHCGYCKRMLPVIAKLLEEDKKVRVVFHELPILSKDSKQAAKAALAVFQLKPDVYFDYHSKLMNTPGKYTLEMLTEEAVKRGVDKATFEEAMKSDALDNALKSSAELAKNIGISGTPALVINDELVPGAIGYDQLKEMIAEIRAE